MDKRPQHYSEEMPERLNTPGKRAIYSNLKAKGVAESAAVYVRAAEDEALQLALRIDDSVRRVRPDGWRGVQAREQVIKGALYDILRDAAEVERLFLVIKAQREY